MLPPEPGPGCGGCGAVPPQVIAVVVSASAVANRRLVSSGVLGGGVSGPFGIDPSCHARPSSTRLPPQKLAR